MAGRERDDVVPVQTDGRGGITTRNTLHWKLKENTPQTFYSFETTIIELASYAFQFVPSSK